MTIVLNIPREQRPSAPETTLVYYDGPQLFWLAETQGYRYLAICLDGLVEAPWPFLVVKMTPFACARLMAGTLPLRQAVLEGEACYLLADYGAEALELVGIAGQIPENWLPGNVPLMA